jgi:hypothetical protein
MYLDFSTGLLETPVVSSCVNPVDKEGDMDRKRLTIQSSGTERGANQIGVLFLLLVFSGLAYVCYRIGPFYYDYYEILGLMEAQARKAQVVTDVQIRQNVLQQIKKRGVPIENDDNFKINRVGDEIIMDLDYTEVLDFEWKDKVYTIHEFEFNAHVQQKYQ